jgi:hypothetical protein
MTINEIGTLDKSPIRINNQEKFSGFNAISSTRRRMRMSMAGTALAPHLNEFDYSNYLHPDTPHFGVKDSNQNEITEMRQKETFEAYRSDLVSHLQIILQYQNDVYNRLQESEGQLQSLLHTIINDNSSSDYVGEVYDWEVRYDTTTKPARKFYYSPSRNETKFTLPPLENGMMLINRSNEVLMNKSSKVRMASPNNLLVVDTHVHYDVENNIGNNNDVESSSSISSTIKSTSNSKSTGMDSTATSIVIWISSSSNDERLVSAFELTSNSKLTGLDSTATFSDIWVSFPSNHGILATTSELTANSRLGATDSTAISLAYAPTSTIGMFSKLILTSSAGADRLVLRLALVYPNENIGDPSSLKSEIESSDESVFAMSNDIEPSLIEVLDALKSFVGTKTKIGSTGAAK